MNNNPELTKLKIVHRRPLTPTIAEFTLAAENGGALAGFEPGAHVPVRTPDGAMRRYSLVNDGSAPESYVIAVKREWESRGGSSSMHDQGVPGSELLVGLPENDFPLVPGQKSFFVAGGIGITPILAMARRTRLDGKPFRLVYCTRSPSETAYLEEIRSEFGDRAILHHDDGIADKAYDFWDDFAVPDNSQVYCCGPGALMEEIKAVSGHWPEGSIHFEDFKPVEVVRDDDVAFQVTLAATGQVVNVPADRTILESLRDAGLRTVSSCESGTCGTCRCRLVAGTVDHRDRVLMDEERTTNLMICVSRAKDGDLVIDL